MIEPRPSSCNPLARARARGHHPAAMDEAIVVSAPGRANLIGNPSDQYGGCTLACSVPLRARVRLDPKAPGRLSAGGEEANVSGRGDLARRGDALDLGRAVLAHFGLEAPPFGLAYRSEIPRQSGMAGSTALFVAAVHAVSRALGRELRGHALAEAARTAEAEGLGVQCGYVDQYACTFGGLRHVDLRAKSVARDDAVYATVEDLGPHVPALPFLLAYTGVRHSSDAVHRPIRQRWLAGEPEVVEAYREVAEIGVRGKSALQRGDFDELGALMNRNHAIQRGLGGSGEPNERLIAAALAAGAPGAKLAGAGDGGTIVALWPEGDRAPLEGALREAGAAALYPVSLEPGVRREPDPAAW